LILNEKNVTIYIQRRPDEVGTNTSEILSSWTRQGVAFSCVQYTATKVWK